MISILSLRNIATLLSVVLAVTGLVTAFNYSATAKYQILTTLNKINPDLVIIEFYSAFDSHRLGHDIAHLQTEFPQSRIAPFVTKNFSTHSIAGNTLLGTIVYTNEKIFEVLPISLRAEAKDTLKNSSCGSALFAKNLAPYFVGSFRPQGKSVIIDKKTFFIVDTFTCKDTSIPIDWSYCILTYLPQEQFEDSVDGSKILFHLSNANADTISDRITSVLLQTHTHKDFNIQSFKNILEQKIKITNSIELLTESISLIILTMASISCMNIFFIAVNERTKEIGLRRALGASTGEILFMIMRECYIFISLGAVLGMMGGYLFTQYLMKPLLLIMPEFSGWQFDMYSDSILKTLLFLIVSATLSGLAPAIRAAQIEPSIALRDG